MLTGKIRYRRFEHGLLLVVEKHAKPQLVKIGESYAVEKRTTWEDADERDLQELQELHELNLRDAVDKAWAGDAAAVAKAAQEWGADKANLQDRLTFLRTTIRQKLLHSTTDPASAAVWSNALQNVLDAEYLALDRHVNPTLIIFKTLQSCSHLLGSMYQTAPNQIPTIGETLMDGR